VTPFFVEDEEVAFGSVVKVVWCKWDGAEYYSVVVCSCVVE
jgi:hypothetical protein